MRIEITGRHLTITPATRAAVDRRLTPVLRTLNDRAVSAHVVLTGQKARVHAEVTLHARGVHFLHGDAIAPNVGAALSGALDKVERQAARLKGKATATKGGRRITALPPAPREEAPAGPRIIRTRRSAVRPMTTADAAGMVGDGADAVLVFRNADTGALTVLFRRPDGNLGLIEPEI